MTAFPTPSGPVIRTSGLTKRFARGKRTVHAVRGLDLEVQPGELVALLGPNGAGKSTTLRMLTTLLEPTAGSAEVAGHDVVTARRDVRRSIGYVGQGNGASHQQRGRDELVSQGRAHGLSRTDARARAAELIERFGLQECADRPVSTLSGGQRRRLDVAIGLVHFPPLLFLDEPSTGLDPQNRANLQEQIRELHEQEGTTVVLTTHYLEEADQLAGRVVVIDHGAVIADDTGPALKSALGDLIVMGFDSAADAATAAERLVPRTSSRAGRLAERAAWLEADADVERAGHVVRLRVARGRDFATGLVRDLAEAGLTPSRLEVSGPTLDDVFLDLTGRSLREAGHEHATDTETETEGVAA